MQTYLLFDIGFIGTGFAFVVDPSDGHRVAFFGGAFELKVQEGTHWACHDGFS
jgi:hypothetical protein